MWIREFSITRFPSTLVAGFVVCVRFVLVAAPFFIELLRNFLPQFLRAHKMRTRTQKIFRFTQRKPGAIQAGVHKASRPVVLNRPMHQTSRHLPQVHRQDMKKTQGFFSPLPQAGSRFFEHKRLQDMAFQQTGVWFTALLALGGLTENAFCVRAGARMSNRRDSNDRGPHISGRAGARPSDATGSPLQCLVITLRRSLQTSHIALEPVRESRSWSNAAL